MTSLKQLAPKISAPVEEIRTACQILGLRISQEGGVEALLPYQDKGNNINPEEIITRIASVAIKEGTSFIEKAQELADQMRQHSSQAESSAQPGSTADNGRFNRDAYNMNRFGTTQAPEGSVVGVFMADQIPAEAFGEQRHALFMDYATGILNDRLIHGAKPQNPTTPQSDIDKYRQVPQASTDILTAIVTGSVNWGVGTAALGGTTTLPQLVGLKRKSRNNQGIIQAG